jgi:adenylate cyclase
MPLDFVGGEPLSSVGTQGKPCELTMAAARENYEVYVLQEGRWQVHLSFEGADREKAQNAALDLDKTSRAPVRLVRETINPETNTSEEVIAWQNAKAKDMPDADDMFGQKAKEKPKKKDKPRPPASAPRAKAAPEPAFEAQQPAAPRKRRKKKKKKKSNSVLTKIGIVVAMSLAMAAGATAATMFAIGALTKFRIIQQDDRSAMVAGAFVLSYGISALYQLVRQFELNKYWNFNFSFRRRAKAPKASPTEMIKKMKTAAPTGADMSEINMDTPGAGAAAMAQAALEELRESVAQQDAEEAGDRQQDDDAAAETQVEQPEEQAPLPESEPPPPAPEPPKPVEPPKAEKPAEKQVAPPPPPEPPKPVEKPPERPPAEVEAQKHFMGFVGDAVKVANGTTQLNAMSRFGLNLYLAGACSTLGQSRKLGRMPQLTILRDSLESAGTSRARAESFCAELPSYGKNPRYSSMLQAGGNAMTRHMAGNLPATTDLAELLGEWGRPEKRSAVPAEITFLFTDLVGSTAMTSQLGNAAAQKIVRAHNSAVRDALKAFGGREVKHTGDGIMATFPSPIAGVQATIQMQKELVRVATSNPALNFSVRMGLNVGEAVMEDNDYFGGAVQMTARICAAASERNIWVSKSIVDACKGQRIGFIPRGAFSMKGIQGARPLYEVAYTDAHRNELANL